MDDAEVIKFLGTLDAEKAQHFLDTLAECYPECHFLVLMVNQSISATLIALQENEQA